MNEETTTETPSQLWDELKLAFTALEADATKNLVKGNASAGVRLRKALRHARRLALQLVRATTVADKASKAKRKETKKVVA